jgi:hypothetical protein
VKDYFNTNREVNPVLAVSRTLAKTQQDIILWFFEQHPGQRFMPEEIRERLFRRETPLTSVRRAITNLTDAGELEKTDFMKSSSFGKMVHTWELRRAPGQLKLFE